ncbi:MAG TPA: Asp-tRNA(Asn)/Glu-tRNA(Gln) amidotransferase subunit GatA, partial [Campylobacterales bacterium]|nr:Asp-tRNA(Asn)/Glu-tRNA(Gln) amidotransferase subunit GatA [Campylobacterales bacterium]
MITLKEALTKSKDELDALKIEMETKAKEGGLNAYIDFASTGEGIPILIKDNIQVKDWSMTSASEILQGYVAPYNATVIENLHNKGFSAFGRANMDEFAMGSTTESSYYGVTKNPHDLERVPGGSSGGSAAAVAGGIAIAALGSDTGGSIRQPAAYCGCVGMKPTYGRVSRFGLGAYASSLDQIGPITQNVEDAAILYDAIASHDEKDSTCATLELNSIVDNLDADRKLTIAVIDNYIAQASEEIQEAYAMTVEKLKEAGHIIVHKNMGNTKYDIATY